MRVTHIRIGSRPRAAIAAAALAVLSVPATPVHAATVGAVQTYIVTYKDGASSSGAGAAIQGAGGQLVYNYAEIGVAIARSNRSDFAANVQAAKGVDGAVATTNFATHLDNSQLGGSGHGTHSARTLAAARNGIGIVGVAPNVKLAAIKSGDAAGFFFPETVVCAFWWAGTHHFNVTNNSYFADPYYFNCKNDPTQR